MNTLLTALQDNFPSNIRVSLSGAGVADFNVGALGWLADPEFNLRPSYGSPEFATIKHLRQYVAKILGQIEIKPKDNVHVDGFDEAHENNWLQSVIDQLNDESITSLYYTHFKSETSGISIAITFSVSF